ncbi:fibroblast growth factor-binding protein 3 [Rhynchocyon petersi]
MTPPSLQASLSLLVLGGCLLAAARREEGAAGSLVQPVQGPVGGSSGRFVSPERQECSWQLLPPRPGAAVGSELQLSCQGPAGARTQCVHRWEPAQCVAYAARGAQYWKQLLGRLHKKRLPCHDPARLRARLCSAKKGRDASLRLVLRAPPAPGPTAPGFTREPKPRARGRGRPRGPGAGAPPPTSTPSKEKPSETKTKGAKRKGVSDTEEEPSVGTRPDLNRLDQNSELTETYCAEKWHSLCNFFVSFWNG